MGERRKESVAEVLVSRVIGIVVFLIVLGILNILAGAYVQAPIFLQSSSSSTPTSGCSS